MAAMETSYRPAKAMRMWLEQVVPSEREIQELLRRSREEQSARWRTEQRHAEQKTKELAAAVGGDPANIAWRIDSAADAS